MFSLTKINKTFFNLFQRQFSVSSITLNVESKTDNVKTEKETHFGFETVKESEKAKKGL